MPPPLNAEVRLRRVGDDVELTIADDGKGFDIGPGGPTGHGLGLISINERVRLVGGNVSIVTEVNKGTRVKVHVPLDGAQSCRALSKSIFSWIYPACRRAWRPCGERAAALRCRRCPRMRDR